MSLETAPVESPPTRRRLAYQPSLDGLRAVAVAGVVAFHLGYLQGGFLGVDLFFTLSGYLITRLLLLERDSTGRIARGAFWKRRAWRLLPAFYLLLVAMAVYAASFARPDELEGIRGPGLSSLVYLANWWFIGAGDGYWDIFSAPSPLEHVWSLAIEEQFYVVWPLLVVLALGARRSVGRLLAVTVALIVASTVWLGVLATDDLSRAYFGSFARFGSILVGAALAMVIHRGDRWVGDFTRSRAAPWIGAAAAAFLAWSWITIDGGLDLGWYRGGFLAHAVAVAVLIALLTSRPDGLAATMLSFGPLRGLGVVSYGLYLWHWPVIVIVDADRTGLSGAPLLVVRLAIAMAVTLVSYFLLERPARQVAAKRVSALVVFPLAAAGVAVALIVSTVPPAAQPVIGAPPPPAAVAEPATETQPAREIEPEGVGEAPADGVGEPVANVVADTLPTAADPPQPALVRTTPTALPTLRTPTAADPLRVLLVGDSYMFDAAPGIVASTAATGAVATAAEARLGFSVTVDGWEQTLAELVEAHRPELVIAMWARFDAAWLEANDPVDYEQRLDRAVEILTGDGAVLGFVGLAPSLTAGVDRVEVDRSINALFEALPSRHPGRAFYVDPDPIVAPDGAPERWIETPEGRLLVRKTDVSHYCGDGSARFGLAVAELLVALADVAPADPAAWWAGEWRADPRYDDPAGACA